MLPKLVQSLSSPFRGRSGDSRSPHSGGGASSSEAGAGAGDDVPTLSPAPSRRKSPPEAMPGEAQVNEQFEEFMNSRGFPEKAKGAMRMQPIDMKWKMVLQYKQLQAQEESKPKTSPEEWVEKLTALVGDEVDPAESSSVLNQFRVVMNAVEQRWLIQFTQAGGLEALIHVQPSKNPRVVHDILRCVRAFINSDFGLGALLENEELVRSIVMFFPVREDSVRVSIMQLLTVMVFVSDDGQTLALDSLQALKDDLGLDMLYQPLLQCLGSQETKNVQVKSTVLTFLNAVVNTFQELDERLHHRKLLLDAGMDDLLAELRHLSNTHRSETFVQLGNQVDVFQRERDADHREVLENENEDLKRKVSQLQQEKKTIEAQLRAKAKIVAAPAAVAAAPAAAVPAAGLAPAAPRPGGLAAPAAPPAPRPGMAPAAPPPGGLAPAAPPPGAAPAAPPPGAAPAAPPPGGAPAAPPPGGVPPAAGIPRAPGAPPVPGAPPAPGAPPVPGGAPRIPGAPPAPGIGAPPSLKVGPALPKRKEAKPTKPMRKMHWTPVPVAAVATGDTFWNPKHPRDEKIKLDSRELEELFSAKSAPKPRAGDAGGDGGAAGGGPARGLSKAKSAVTLLDSKRSNNISIGLARFRMQPEEIRDSILAMDEVKLHLDNVNKLINYAPDAEEIELVQAYDGPAKDLAAAEKFCLAVSSIPSCKQRLELMAFKLQFETLVEESKVNVTRVLAAIRAIRGSKALGDAFGIILAFGNYMNAGSKQGGAYGFKLGALKQLNATKTTDNKMNLMQYLVRFVDKSYPNTRAFLDDLECVDDAVRVEKDVLNSELGKLRKRLKQLDGALNKDYPGKDKFKSVMSKFRDEARPQFAELDRLATEANSASEALGVFYGEKKNIKWEQLFEIFAQFRRDFITADRQLKAIEAAEAKAQKQAAFQAELTRRQSKAPAATGPATEGPSSPRMRLGSMFKQKGKGGADIVDNVMGALARGGAADIREALRKRRQNRLTSSESPTVRRRPLPLAKSKQ